MSWHPSAIIDLECARIGESTQIWHHAYVGRGAVIGERCMIGQGVHIGPGVKVGDGCRIQNGAQLFEGVTLEENVFVGPHVVFTNVLTPRAFVKRADAFDLTLVKKGVSIGANATILCGIEIGEYAIIGAGSVVTKPVVAYALVYGNPAVKRRSVCVCGEVLGRATISAPCPDIVKLPPCRRCNAKYVYNFKTNLVTPSDAQATP